MSLELTLNLLFSATYEPMHYSLASPPREVRIAHNQARRLLAEQYGFEEWQALMRQVDTEALFRRSTGLAMTVLGAGAMLTVGIVYSLFKRN